MTISIKGLQPIAFVGVSVSAGGRCILTGVSYSAGEARTLVIPPTKLLLTECWVDGAGVFLGAHREEHGVSLWDGLEWELPEGVHIASGGSVGLGLYNATATSIVLHGATMWCLVQR